MGSPDLLLGCSSEQQAGALADVSHTLCMQYGSDLEEKPEKGLDRRRDLPVEQLEWELGLKEEEMAVREFKQNIGFNMGKVPLSRTLILLPPCKSSTTI